MTATKASLIRLTHGEGVLSLNEQECPHLFIGLTIVKLVRHPEILRNDLNCFRRFDDEDKNAS